MTDLLPEVGEREWVIEALADIARQSGRDPLVAAPVLLPVAEFFPDTWTPDARGVHRLARRLHVYAGLDELDVDVRIFEEERASPDVSSNSVKHEGAAAYFAGIVDEVCLYGVNADRLDDGLGVTATMAHEVAHAFRTRFGLAILDPERVDEEERLTDLTTVYLGFGVLTTNATARHRSTAADGGLIAGHQWSFTSLGYLSPATMAFALAVVAVARDLDGATLRTVAGELEPNQAASFRRGIKWLRRCFPDLCARLGLPEDPEEWPEPWLLDELTRPLGDTEEEVVEGDGQNTEDQRDVEPWNEGRPVFRVLPGHQRGEALFLGIASFVIGTLASFIHGLLGLASAAIAFFFGRELVRRLGSLRCSDSECRERISRQTSTCPNCGGVFVGNIRHPDERLAAEEARDRGSRADLEG
ncbi:hypothetical protein PPSIR1_01352 [Plesiocystis pacifica SIR-1]|uniref:Uncharacterized protein n=1 Tax=Plesiocystis pacifica SIR-1 TaxID=391625 RepID=A6G8C1_9BACT|nr:hypothetical protein [Plesiocystis pacifica]EDM77831.1 hypothetical protein PPSIR1_01352 [Plesiocystis pacifica SIR-1]